MTTTDSRLRAAGARASARSPAFVFDCVCHIFNFDKANALGPPGEMFDEHLYAFHQFLTAEGEPVLSPRRVLPRVVASTRSTTWSSRARTPT